MRVAVPGGELGEELVADDLLLVLVHLLGAVGQDHVVEPLVRGAGDLRVLEDDSRGSPRTCPPSASCGSRPDRAAGGSRRGLPCRWPSEFLPIGGQPQGFFAIAVPFGGHCEKGSRAGGRRAAGAVPRSRAESPPRTASGKSEVQPPLASVPTNHAPSPHGTRHNGGASKSRSLTLKSTLHC